MKAVILFLLFPFHVFSQNTSETGFDFPANFFVDPYNHDLKQLGVTQVTQLYKNDLVVFADTIEQKKTPRYLQYVLEFDSLQRPYKFKFDFQKQVGHILTNPSSQISVVANIDSSRVFWHTINGKNEPYNYFEYTYIYKTNGLSSIKVFDPSPFRGVVDGVYVQDVIYINSEIKNEVDNKGNLIKTEFYSEGILVYTKKYNYEIFKHDRHEARLLTSIEYKDEFGDRTTFLEYSFE